MAAGKKGVTSTPLAFTDRRSERRRKLVYHYMRRFLESGKPKKTTAPKTIENREVYLRYSYPYGAVRATA